MTFFYSATTGGFYSDAVHPTRPEDCVEISDADYYALIDGQASGGTISVCSTTGLPEVVTSEDTPAATRARLIASVKREASRRILIISPEWRQLNDLRSPSEDAQERFIAIDAVRSASNAIELQIGETADEGLGAFDVANNALWSADPPAS
ncbi:hypothetical protein [Novosphingobium sp. KA1]|uniref:hypothetical protein n=1 Tax=Novosphingobium sp. (strain KA1) TaxID=164608 RepID=UPI001A8BFD34|nr:hypothetical protein [Novosphingobium sp. KA1]QSR16080.1 hypothetical protein CA833_02515 [Novosphingobium sp. KA1]